MTRKTTPTTDTPAQPLHDAADECICRLRIAINFLNAYSNLTIAEEKLTSGYERTVLREMIQEVIEKLDASNQQGVLMPITEARP